MSLIPIAPNRLAGALFGGVALVTAAQARCAYVLNEKNKKLIAEMNTLKEQTNYSREVHLGLYHEAMLARDHKCPEPPQRSAAFDGAIGVAIGLSAAGLIATVLR